MNRDEALRTLGLEDDATESDIKAAYKEMAQILHPDKFTGNKRLEERATEQFKRVNEAKELLLSGRGSNARRGAGSAWPGGGAWPGSGTGGWPGGGAGSWPGGGGSWSGNAGQSARSAASSEPWTDSDRKYGDAATVAGIKARLAGIAAARTQLIQQLDSESDTRRTAIFALIGGIVLSVIVARFRFLILGLPAGILLVGGVTRFFGAQANIKIIRGHLKKLDEARKSYEEKLDSLA